MTEEHEFCLFFSDTRGPLTNASNFTYKFWYIFIYVVSDKRAKVALLNSWCPRKLGFTCYLEIISICWKEWKKQSRPMEKADNKSWICIRFTQILGTGVTHCTPWFTLSHNMTRGKYLIVLHSLVHRFSRTTGEEGDKYLFVSGFMYFVNTLHPLAHSLSHNVRVVDYLMDAWIVAFSCSLFLSHNGRGVR